MSRGVDRAKSLDRVVELGRQFGAHHGSCIPPGPPGGVAPIIDVNRNGYLGNQRLAWELAAIGQIATQCTSADTEHDVIDRYGEDVLDELRFRQSHRAKGEPAIGGDGSVERRARRLKRQCDRRPFGRAASAEHPEC